MTSAPAPLPTGTSRFTDRFGLATLLETLRSPVETPASGSAAAAAAALAAALVAKVALATGDHGTAAQADTLAARLTVFAAEDADAYEAATRALAQPGGSETHDFLLGAVLRRAAEVPLQIAEAAADTALLAAALAASAPPDQHADLVGAARLSEGAARAAAHLVEINLAARPGDDRLARARDAIDAAAAAGDSLGGRHG